MDSEKRRILEKRLEVYSGLLKEHETGRKKCELVSTSIYQLSKNSSWKQPSFSANKMFKNSTQQLTSNINYPYNKVHQSSVRNRNIRTVLYNEVHKFKDKYKLTSDRTVKNIPSNEVICQRTVLNTYPFTQYKKPVLCPENTSEASKITSGNSEKVSSTSLALIKEIESLTKVLKKTSENKSKVINTTAKIGSSAQDTLHNFRSSSSNFKYCAFSKCNVLKNNHPIKKQFKITRSGINSSVGLKKSLSGFSQTNFISDDKSKHISNLTHLNTLNVNKYCYKKVNTKMPSSKAPCTPLKTIDNKNETKSNVQKSLPQLHLLKVTSQNFKSVADNLSCNTPKLEIKSLNQDSKLNMKAGVTLEPIISVTKISNVNQNIILKSQDIHKSTGVSKINCANSKYKRINTVHSVISNKNMHLKRASSHHKTSSTKKTKGKVNTKFKIVNKIVTPCASRKVVLEKSILGCKENSPMAVDKSDPLFKFLNDPTVDKLEKDLLALSTTMTAEPLSVKNDHKKLQTKFSKINTKLSHKKMPLKKSKSRISKYKVVNSIVSHSSAVKNKQNFASPKNVKKIKSKFSLINKHVLPVNVTPIPQGKSILIKRLFKSKNAIINRNASSTNHSAKMIKYKYFARNKRKLPYESPALYPKVPKFKGYLSTKLYSKKNGYQKAPILSYSQRVMRRFSHYGCNTDNSRFNNRVSGNNCKKKLHNRYGHSPVVFIRGLKYSCNSSGKTLRKLPAQDFTKIHRKVVINGKRYGRIPENKMKAMTPVSANLASQCTNVKSSDICEKNLCRKIQIKEIIGCLNYKSRVLHRSITRVLSASSKKKLTKVNSYCMFYNRFGRCNRGVKCTYIHDPSKIAVCTRFLRGTCKVDGCPFSHEIAPGKMAICSFFLVGACDKDDCAYRHENLSPNAELCKAFVQGYCPSGKECKKAHILICPKYIQGNCEKGTSCAFPHPPQKVRKNVPKEIEGENKQDDALLEKVARYFQPSEDASLPCESKSDDNNAVNLFVPKQRRLEEQPSFIPLFDSPTILNNSCKE